MLSDKQVRILRIIVPPKHLAGLAELIMDNTITYETAKYVLKEMILSGIKYSEK